MKSPIDDLLSKNGEESVGRKSAGDQPARNKAYERLKLFALERGLPVPSPVPNGSPPKKEGPRGRKAKTEAGESGATVTEEEYARELMNAAAGLTQQPGQVEGKQRGAEQGATENANIGMYAPQGTTGPFWRFLGPTMMANGQTYGESRVVVSGRVSSVAVDPSNANHVLVGAAAGGVWESFNRGASWSPRTDYMTTMAVGAIAFNPSSPNVVFCGTGEGDFYRSLGAGVYRSVNGGTTWTVLATAPFVGQGFFDLVVDRANGSRLIAATTGGVYTSIDAGATWTQRKAGICWDVAVHPAGGNTAEILAAFVDGIYRSTNWGTSWTKLTIAGFPASFSRLEVAIAPSNPAVAYAFGASGSTSVIFRRNAAGAWATVPGPAGLSTGQAWYDWFLGISPDNDFQIYLGAIEAYRGTFISSAWNWVTISNKAGDDIHPDQHAIAFDPTNANNIYVGNDGGLFYSTNRGTNWSSLNNGLGITEIEYMGVDYGSSRWIIAGTQDNGSIRYLGSSAWEHVADGDGGDCGVNAALPTTVYHSYYGMGMERSTTKGNWGSFGWIGPNVPQGYNSLFYPPMEVCNDTVAQGGQSLFVSRNRGTNWTEVLLPAGSLATAMYIPNVNTIFVGTSNGNVYRVSWSGAAWSAPVALTRPRAGAYISDIHVQRNNLNRIWVTSSTINGGRVFRSDNGGTNWTDLTAGLPNLPINAVEVDPGNSNRVWIAADIGVYQSINAGVNWSHFSNGLPSALAVDLVYHHHARVLRVAMRNRGVWEIPVFGWLTNPVCGLQWNGVLSPYQTQRWYTFNWPATWHMLWTIMPTTFTPGYPSLSWNVQVERASAEYVTYWISVTNLTASTINFEGRYAILSYY